MPRKRQVKKQVETLTHKDAKRKNIPTVEYEPSLHETDKSPVRVSYERRNRDLDPQLVWRGKDEQDWSDLVVQAPPLYIQEKIHPKAIIDDLKRQAESRRDEAPVELDLFADFNGLGDADKTEFYQHDQNWQNRMILGDSLQVMASLAEREGLRGQVQCIYIDPPYGIKFNSNWQVSTRSRDVKDSKMEHVTREPEQVKAFRDTWKHGIHSYLTYLRDRLTVARDLLSESGSIFVQIGNENVHRVRAVMDEIFGEGNHVASIVFRKTTGKAGISLDNTYDVAIWFAKNSELSKVRKLFFKRDVEADRNFRFDFKEAGIFEPASNKPYRIARMNPITSQSASKTTLFEFNLHNQSFKPGKGGWKTNIVGMERLRKASRLTYSGQTLGFVRLFEDYPYQTYNDIWDDTRQSGFGDEKVYVVQTGTRVIQRCLLMTTDPGDLILDPTCGSGTTAYVAEHWGRRWITIDTSRVALALARTRIMSARYPYYLLVDSSEGQKKEAELTQTVPKPDSTHGSIRQGFVYERVPHVTLKSIANNAEIDVIWEKYQESLEPLLKQLNAELNHEWQVPREADDSWTETVKHCHSEWWKLRIERQKEIDASISAKADYETLYDKPYTDNTRVRVSGPFTVESLSPHRMISADEDYSIASEEETDQEGVSEAIPLNDFTQMILENMKSVGVHQVAKEDRITFSTIEGWPGEYIAAVGHYTENDIERRAGIFIGPEYGTITRSDLANAASEAQRDRFDALIACGFNFDAHTSELTKLGPLPILKARMNTDLHMSDELKNTGSGNLFVVFGEPDIEWNFDDDGNIVVEVLGVDVFDPKTSEVRDSGKGDIAAWFIDTDYNRESFFVRHAYFMGANDPYKSLKTSLKAEIDKEAWETLYHDTSRPFARPESGRFAVKVIN
ncbi:MAG: site-specific DNA-methyltransferase, partial [Gammaproteobacteria bacterium]|nr:site-specific DNA-methyltransferase [Gammaproteobacteria bacterium]